MTEKINPLTFGCILQPVDDSYDIGYVEKIMGVELTDNYFSIPDDFPAKKMLDVLDRLEQYHCFFKNGRLYIYGKYDVIPEEFFHNCSLEEINSFIENFSSYYSHNYFSYEAIVWRSYNNARVVKRIKTLSDKERKLYEQHQKNLSLISTSLIDEFSTNILTNPSSSQIKIIEKLIKGGHIERWRNSYSFYIPIFHRYGGNNLHHNSIKKLMKVGIIKKIDGDNNIYHLSDWVIEKFKAFLKKKGITGWSLITDIK